MKQAFVFDNRSIRDLPADPIEGSARRQIKDACFSRVQPTAVRKPALVAVSSDVADALGFDAAFCESNEFLQVFAGNGLLRGMDPHATCYGGHQFGNWAGQLGDGRAINLGEIVDAKGELQMLQLKGAGSTPYSRTADGLAVLRSSVREFLCSEAMHHLGVPTTRALSLSLTGEQVMRDMLYDGNAAFEPGAVVCRVAPSFTRFGHFEILTAREELPLLRDFTRQTISQLFPQVAADFTAEALNELSPDVVVRWFEQVCESTAAMIVHWMRVGFVHGVMNTDNMSILGLTIDYGPYGWLDIFDPDWTPNTTDAGQRRYRYGQQPAVAQWNLMRLANAIYPLVGTSQPLEQALADFEHHYQTSWLNMRGRKLGIFNPLPGDGELFTELDQLMSNVETDMTIFYRRLADLDLAVLGNWQQIVGDAFYEPEQLTAAQQAQWMGWMQKYSHRLGEDANIENVVESRRSIMNAVNPKFVLRNYMAQVAIDQAEQGDFKQVNELLEVLRSPYTDRSGSAPNQHLGQDLNLDKWAQKRPDWARTRVGCSQLSCSS